MSAGIAILNQHVHGGDVLCNRRFRLKWCHKWKESWKDEKSGSSRVFWFILYSCLCDGIDRYVKDRLWYNVMTHIVIIVRSLEQVQNNLAAAAEISRIFTVWHFLRKTFFSLWVSQAVWECYSIAKRFLHYTYLWWVLGEKSSRINFPFDDQKEETFCMSRLSLTNVICHG